MRFDRIISLAVLTVALLAGCQARQVAEGTGSTAVDCTFCHGGVDNQTGAPPRPAGSGALHAAAVGAHTKHLASGVTCETCHHVPTAVNSPGHADGGRAQVIFGAAASRDGANPTFVASTQGGGSCASVYCHGGGGTLENGAVLANAGGAHTTPVWGDTYTGCGTCHGDAPPNHGGATNLDCSTCHPTTVASVVNGVKTLVPGGTHLNGRLDLDITKACTLCHGDANRVIEPPLNKAAPASNAHLQHLQGRALSNGFRCQECHAIPTGLDHVGPPPAVLTFQGPIGTTEGQVPGYDAATHTCSNVYCHGATLAGGTHAQPKWTLGASEAACGNCHGSPPSAPHPQLDADAQPFTGTAQCAGCHPGTVNADGTIDRAGGLHVNGVVDTHVHPDGWATPSGGYTPHGKAANFHQPAQYPNGIVDCQGCHGQDFGGTEFAPSCNACHAAVAAGTGRPADWKQDCLWCHGDVARAGGDLLAPPDLAKAPPTGTNGETSTSDLAVGAHQRHLGTGTKFTNGVACTSCHVVPTDLSHVNGTPALAFSGLATTGTTPATVTPGTGTVTCANYCHEPPNLTGNLAPLRTNAGGGLPHVAPSWTQATGALTCNSCHDRNPQTGQHPAVQSAHRNVTCGTCHGAAYTLVGTTDGTVDKALHLNGAKNVPGVLAQWDPVLRGCAAACHQLQNGVHQFHAWDN